jgi:hypothetical protein
MGLTQGNSMYNYLYPKLTKMPCFSYYLLWFFSPTKSENRREEQVLPGKGGGRVSEGVGLVLMD